MGGCLIKWSYHIRWRCLRQSCLIKQGCHINNNMMCILVKARDFTQLFTKFKGKALEIMWKIWSEKVRRVPLTWGSLRKIFWIQGRFVRFVDSETNVRFFLLHLYHWNLAAEISYQDTFFFRNMSLFLQGGWVVNFPRISHFCHMSSLGGGGWV